MSHTVKKKHCFTDLELLRECCEGTEMEVISAEAHVETWGRRGPRATLRAAIKMPKGWVGGNVEVHDKALHYDGDNDSPRRAELREHLTNLSKEYTRRVVGRFEQSMRTRATEERTTVDGRTGTMYTLEVGRVGR